MNKQEVIAMLYRLESVSKTSVWTIDDLATYVEENWWNL